MFVADGQYVTDGHAPGIEAEMDGGLWVSYPPLGPPKWGIHLSAVAGVCRTLQWKARRRGGLVKVIGYGLSVIESMPK